MKSTDSYIQCTAYDGSTCWQEQLSEDIEEWILDVEQQERVMVTQCRCEMVSWLRTNVLAQDSHLSFLVALK